MRYVGAFGAWIARLVNLVPGGRHERELDAELRAHVGLHVEENLRAGMHPAEARRVAHARLGGVEQVKERCREVRPFRWIGTTWLDLTLGLRMLRKYWGLTLVGGLAMTIAIGIGGGVFAIFHTVWGATLPLDDGNRVVAVQTWDAGARQGRGTALGDFERWRDDLRSLVDVGAFRTVERSLTDGDGPAETVSVAEMTASGFGLARVPPLLGRPLVEADARDGAAAVVVIGYETWQQRFLSDSGVVGRRIRLGTTDHTVVGVMPDDFAFPMNHSFWTPLRTDLATSLPDRGPGGVVFARLAPGVTIDSARAELATIGLLPPAPGAPETGERVAPRLVPYTLAFAADLDGWMIRLVLFLVTLLLVPPCANIAILVYARTVTRQEEFAARYALGASRGRIVSQLFIEVLVLSGGAAVMALLLLRMGLSRVLLSGDEPFWIDLTLSSTTVLFTAGLAMLAALIAGLIPAIQATGRLMQSGLRTLSSRTGPQLGRTWTALVVVQVALSLGALPTAVELGWGTLRSGLLGPGFAAEEFLTARLTMERESPLTAENGTDRRQFADRFADRQTELVRQLESEPGVRGVTVSAALAPEAPWALIEVDSVSAPSEVLSGQLSGHRSQFNQVDDLFFDVFNVPLLTGRGFNTGDLEPERAAVIVDQTFVQQIMGDGNPLGTRVRHASAMSGRTLPAALAGRWFEIVGVVADLRANTDAANVYHPAPPPGQLQPVRLTLRTGPGVAGVPGRLREMAAALDPTLRVDELRSLDEIYLQQRQGNNLGASALAVVTLSVLLLSAAGMYALMSFTVARRRREIGIRSALGAQPRHLLAGIFRRALGQVAVGALVGVLAALVLGVYLPVEELGGWHVPGVLPAAATIMMLVGLLSTAGPARRSLQIEPSEALRDS